MEQTMLERGLEAFLATIDMNLGPRMYAEDFKIKRAMDDMVTNVKSGDSNLKKVICEIYGTEGLSREQFWSDDNPFLERHSSVYKGLGFEYSVDADAPDGQMASSIADDIIRRRNFGKEGEFLVVWYNGEFGTVSLQDPAQLREFYRDFAYRRLMFHCSEDLTIFVNNLEKDYHYKGSEIIRVPLALLSLNLQGKTLNEETMQILFGYLGQMQQAVGKKS